MSITYWSNLPGWKVFLKKEIRIGREHERIFWDKVLFLDLGGGYMGIFTLNNLSSGMF